MTNDLFQPIKIGSRIAKNRVAIAAHSSGLMCRGQRAEMPLVSYVEERAWGGVGLFILGETLVHDGTELAGEAWGLAVSSAGIEELYAEVASSAKAHGMLLLDQLSHLGGQVWATQGAQAFAPSAVPHAISGVVPAPMDHEHMARVRNAYVEAAMRAVAGGLDGIELKCDQGKLLHQFLSPRFNQRRDEYGGSDTNNVRFIKEIVGELRGKVPREFIVGIRVSLEGFDTEDHAFAMAVALVEGGEFNYISLTGDTNSTYRGYWRGHGDEETPDATFGEAGRRLRSHVALPVMLAGKIGTVEQASAVLESGMADIAIMTRAHIADPAIVRKFRDGDRLSIRPCIACNQSCVGNTWEGRDVRCIHNAAAGREHMFSDRTIVPAPRTRRVAIVGAGPAGLEAARIAGLMGHEVHVYEASETVGGQLAAASQKPGSTRFIEISEYLAHEVQRLSNVSLHLGIEISTSSANVLDGMDAVLMAIGSEALPPKFEHTTAIVSAPDALSGQYFVSGDRVLVVDEDWIQNGLAIAMALARRGILPEIVTTRESIGSGLNVVSLVSSLAVLREAKVPMSSLRQFLRVDSTGSVMLLDLCTGREEDAGAFAGVVVVSNRLPRPTPTVLEGIDAVEIWPIGDCVFPRGIEYAILDGNRAARLLV